MRSLKVVIMMRIVRSGFIVLVMISGMHSVAFSQPAEAVHSSLGYVDSGAIWHYYDTTGAGVPISGSVTLGATVTTKPQAGTYTIAGCTVGVASASCIATSTVTNHVLVQNTSATASVACHWAGGTAVLNSNGSVQLGPGMSVTWGPSTSGVPSGAMNCIATAASTPLYVEYN